MTGTTSSTNSAQFRIGVFALIFDEDQRVLLAYRRDIDWWNLHGGGMERGETVEDAVRREVREETGLEVEVKYLVGVYSKPQKQEVVLTFSCRATGGVLTITEESVHVAISLLIICQSIPSPSTVSVLRMPYLTGHMLFFVISLVAQRLIKSYLSNKLE